MAKRRIDFTDVPDSPSFKLLPEGIHIMKLDSIEQKTSQAGNDMDEAIFIIPEGEYKGIKIYNHFTFTPASLWKVRNFLTACGVKVPDKAVSVDLEKYVGKKVACEVIHEDDDNGKTKCKIERFENPEELGTSDSDTGVDDDDDDELPI